MLSFTGHWRLTVKAQEPGPGRRIAVAGSIGTDGTHPAGNGVSIDVNGVGFDPWTVQIQNGDDVHGWTDSGMRLGNQVVTAGSTEYTIDIQSEDDPASREPVWDDIVVEARNLDPLFDVPARPFAIRTDDLQMMPDGIFDAALGVYYAGVRIRNTWAEGFAAGSHLLGVTASSRALLGAAGIQVLDAWNASELDAFGQSLTGSGHYVVLPGLGRYATTTVYFKLDCSAAAPGKYDVEFECIEAAMVDPLSARRRVTRRIYVTKSTLDASTGDMRITCPEGTLTLHMERVAAPLPYIMRHRKRTPSTPGIPIDRKRAAAELRRLLQGLERGKDIDICEIQRLLTCYCDCGERDGADDPGNRRSGRFTYPDVPVWPIQFRYTVESVPYTGATGPMPFQDPWWKVLLIIVAVILAIAALISQATDEAYHDSDLVIGTLERWKRDDVDAAVTKLNGSRSLPSPDKTEVLDAQTGETFTIPVVALDSSIGLDGNFMTRSEVDALIASGTTSDLAVYKSGSRSGTTFGTISGWTVFDRSDPDGNTTHFTLKQLAIVRDAHDEAVSQAGDSGSIWAHVGSNRIVGLNHSGDAADQGVLAIASLIADVAAALNIKFM